MERRQTSRGPVYYIHETGRRHPGDQYIIYTRQEEDIQGIGILYKLYRKKASMGHEDYARNRKKTSRGPVYYIRETGRKHLGDRNTTSRGLVCYIHEIGIRHPGDQYTIYTRQEEDMQRIGIYIYIR